MRVFLSYANEDKEIAKKLASKLSEKGYKVWSDEQVAAGENWGLKVGEALEESDAMVVLVSPDSLKSQGVRREIEYALKSENYKDRLIPVLLSQTKEFPWIFEEFNLVKASRDLQETSDRIANAIRKSGHGPKQVAGARRQRG